ncbi:hypothetical protein QQS21_002981 [Conoideocrella luteorostrata]|uniref:Uncharacterized protein n=1 Tax=Conoideocrella luteorostrata TaxID=1105319 RepID=A0AAJ0CU71_9HYPO|nr:hypothetical protein QQS21_002981 [Conoideocrella luteorostrata]
MSKFLKDLEPGSVYVTISLPQTKEIIGPIDPVNRGLSSRPCEVNIATYETHCAQDLAHEEFDWGLYFHRGVRDGIWYHLTRRNDTQFRSSTRFDLDRRQVESSPRLQRNVVGLVRVLHVSQHLCEELAWYMDWLAGESYRTAARSFIWVTSMYLRTWHHIVRASNTPSLTYGAKFDVNQFLRETLNFAYGDVDYAVGGQLPRPIIRSIFGTELGISEQDGINDGVSQGHKKAHR